MRAVIFDLDGTLVDSVADLAAAMNHVLDRHGLPTHDVPTIRSFVGHGARSLVERALAGDASLDLEEAYAAFRARYREHLVVHTRVYEGVPEVLERLRSEGVPTAVLSNKPHAPTVEVVRRLLGTHPFVAVLGQRDGVPRKPAPDAALELAERFGVPPSDVVFVGDSDVDVETARAAGMRSVGCAYGLRDRAELEAAGADAVVDRAIELIDVLTVRAPW
jgi:phosphoglycolate phosphatase